MTHLRQYMARCLTKEIYLRKGQETALKMNIIDLLSLRIIEIVNVSGEICMKNIGKREG